MALFFSCFLIDIVGVRVEHMFNKDVKKFGKSFEFKEVNKIQLENLIKRKCLLRGAKQVTISLQKNIKDFTL